MGNQSIIIILAFHDVAEADVTNSTYLIRLDGCIHNSKDNKGLIKSEYILSDV